MGIVASLSRERSQDGDLAKGGAAQEGDPSNPPPITESPQPLQYSCINFAITSTIFSFLEEEIYGA